MVCAIQVGSKVCHRRMPVATVWGALPGITGAHTKLLDRVWLPMARVCLAHGTITPKPASTSTDASDRPSDSHTSQTHRSKLLRSL